MRFIREAVEALANIAADNNASVQNIGALHLHTVMERVLENIGFTVADRGSEVVEVDADGVERNLGFPTRDTDVSRFTL